MAELWGDTMFFMKGIGSYRYAIGHMDDRVVRNGALE